MTDFHTRVPPGEPEQVTSVKVIDADLGVGNRRLIVASGIVLVSWRRDSDEGTLPGDERVWLDIYASELEQWSAFVGLASIANGESGFVFATDSARVDINRGSGELSLVINDALAGEWSALNRFSYQVVATVVRAASGIAGTISWPTALFQPGTDDPVALQRVLGVVAGHRELIIPEGIPQGAFAYERLTPVAAGSLERLTIGRERCAATYRIANPPMAMPLKVSVSVLDGFGTATSVGRVAGPDVFTLSPTHLTETVDFEVAASQGPK